MTSRPFALPPSHGVAQGPIPAALGALKGRFFDARGFPTGFRCSRASTGWRWQANQTLGSVGADLPRFGHAPLTGAPRGLVLEDSRTTFMHRNLTLANSYWNRNSANLAVDDGVAVAPDGSATASRLAELQAVNASFRFERIAGSVTLGEATVVSIFAKPEQRHVLQLAFPSTAYGSDVWANFDLNAGVVSAQGNGCLLTRLEPLPHGWWRCSLGGESLSSSGSQGCFFQLCASPTQSRLDAHMGEPGHGMQVWAPMREAGARTPGSVILTYDQATSVTRAAEVATLALPPLPAEGLSLTLGWHHGALPSGAAAALATLHEAEGAAAVPKLTLRVLAGELALIVTEQDATRVLPVAALSPDQTCRLSLNLRPERLEASFNGAPVVSTVTRLPRWRAPVLGFGQVGSDFSGLPCWLHDVEVHPAPLGLAALQARSQLGAPSP